MLARLADYMAKPADIRMDDKTVRSYLKKAEIVLSRPQYNVNSPDPEYMVKKDGHIYTKWPEWGEVFYHCNEFNLSWTPTPGTCPKVNSHFSAKAA